MLSDGYVKCKEAEVHRSALSCKISKIMRKKNLNDQLVAILFFLTAKFVMGYPCVRHYILFIIHGPAVLHQFLS